MDKDCWSFWEEDCGWKAEDDWRKREQEARRQSEREFYRRMLNRYRRGSSEDPPAMS